MAQNKTTENENSVEDFINSVEDPVKRADSFRIVEIFKEKTGFEAKMWGTAIIGFGTYHYKYESGREGDAPLAGFSPRKEALTLYLPAFSGQETLLAKLGKHKTSKVCIYVKKLDDIDIEVLKEMVTVGVRRFQAKHR